jgi:hypothetical protein
MHDQLAFLIEKIQANRFVELELTRQGARIAFFVDPFESKRLTRIEFAHSSYFLMKFEQIKWLFNAAAAAAFAWLEINDRDNATKVNLYSNFVKECVCRRLRSVYIVKIVLKGCLFTIGVLLLLLSWFYSLHYICFSCD